MKRIAFYILSVLILTSTLISCTKQQPTPTDEAASGPGGTQSNPSPQLEPLEATGDTPIEQPVASGESIPLILSHDGAPDDIAAAAFIAKHPQIDLIGVINSLGEQHPSRSMDEWQRYLYEVIDKDSAAFGLGAEESLDPQHNEFPSEWRDGADEFWFVDLPSASEDYQSSNGADLIVELVQNSPSLVTILILGGNTDLALAFQQDPGIMENISQVVVMGGAFNQEGNLSDAPGYEQNCAAEWNIYVDPLAASQVFTSGEKISVVPLDGSSDFQINQSDLDLILGSDDPILGVLDDLWSQQLEWSGGEGFKIWDIVAAVAVTNPEYFDWVTDGIDVVTDPGNTHGKTFALNNGSQLTRYAVGTDFSAVHEIVFDILLSMDKELPAAQPMEEDEPTKEPDDVVSQLEILAGIWRGTATTGDGTEFIIQFDLDSGCQINQVCGSYHIDAWGISGDVTFTDIDGETFYFIETNKIGAPSEDEAYEQYLRLLGNGQLEYYSLGSYGTSQGVLTKEE
jgi:purine nucleosidase/pyrimidine-specific ribonucleoside hydrolase